MGAGPGSTFIKNYGYWVLVPQVRRWGTITSDAHEQQLLLNAYYVEDIPLLVRS